VGSSGGKQLVVAVVAVVVASGSRHVVIVIVIGGGKRLVAAGDKQLVVGTRSDGAVAANSLVRLLCCAADEILLQLLLGAATDSLLANKNDDKSPLVVGSGVLCSFGKTKETKNTNNNKQLQTSDVLPGEFEWLVVATDLGVGSWWLFSSLLFSEGWMHCRFVGCPLIQRSLLLYRGDFVGGRQLVVVCVICFFGCQNNK
jgi:hypothetical protein